MALTAFELLNNQIFNLLFILCNTLAIIIWLTTLITDNYSYMDRLWPILPMIYSWIWLYVSLRYNSDSASSTINHSIIKSDFSSQSRLILMVILITLWGTRLAYTFWRRGYYSLKHEDHRWEFVKKKFNYPKEKLKFHIFNFIFMAFLQNWILFGYSLPLWFIQTNSIKYSTDPNEKFQEPFNYLDFLIALLFLIFYSIEAIADEQQWRFQTGKRKWESLKATKKSISEYTLEQQEDFKRGFLTKGLFKYSRHPNYFGDILLWLCIYAFTLSAQYSSLINSFSFSMLFNYSVFSSLSMCYLFQRSVKVTEAISAKKYEQYRDYQSKVGRIWPSFTSYLPEKL
jgi:steroid 5-alpha reductase family enzyme